MAMAEWQQKTWLEEKEMNTGLVIGRIFILVCIVVALFCVVKADDIAKSTFNFRKKDWRLHESSIPKLALICRIWNAMMIIVLLYLLCILPKFL